MQFTDKNINLTANEKNYFKKAGINTATRQFRRHYKRGNLNKHDLDFALEVRSYYMEHLNKDIDPISHLAYFNTTGIKDVRIVPERLFRNHYLWVFNDRPMTDGYIDKNTYDLLFDTTQQVHTVLKRVRGHYFNHDNEQIYHDDIIDLLITDSPEYIIKPSDTNNGVGISKMIIKNNKVVINGLEVTIDEIEEEFGYNFLIQRVINQHEIMSRPHPSSVNTLRMVTLRWNNTIKNLYTFARFGVGHDIKDNAGAGGLSVGVKDNGKFMDYGIRSYRKVDEHPTTKVKIKEFGEIPNYLEIQKFARELHKKILHHDYVSWDIAVGYDGKPVFLEANFFGSSFLNQIALERPTFGDETEEVLKYLKEQYPLKKRRNITTRISNRRLRNNKRLRKKVRVQNQDIKNNARLIRRLKTKNENLKSKNISLKSEIDKIRNSRSWRYTSFLRQKK